MDDIDQKALLTVLVKKLKEYYHQKNVYRLVLTQLKASGVAPDVDEVIEAYLGNPTLQDASNRDLEFLDKRLPTASQADLELALQKWLENLPPTPFSN